MKFTGSNILQTPRVSQVTYQMDGIIVDSTGLYSIQTRQSPPFETGLATTMLFSLASGLVLDPSGRFVSTYNTGEPFSVSGWLDYSSAYRYFSVGKDILSRTPDSTLTGLLSEFVLSCPTSGSLTCDMTLKSTRLTEGVSFDPAFYINSFITGSAITSNPMYVTKDSIQFYQSYEALLTGGPLMAFLDTRFPTYVKYYDNDSSEQNNVINMDYQFDTIYRKVIIPAVINRTGLYSSGIYQQVDVSETGLFSGQFNGIWSGNQFVYQDDIPNSITLSYYIIKSDLQGIVYPSTINWTCVLTNQQPAMLPAEYITGFQLTNSGAYASPPLITCSGYYYSTGIQQSLSSLLFTTGCTGDIVVTFSGGGGSGASGFLQLQPILFSGVYVDGQSWYNIAYNYFTSGVGTGYFTPPKAYINTGMYGQQCYDVPRTLGYNQAWFSPFDTSGTMDVEAGWFTGEALCTTGITGDGLTGYFVTGIDVYNIGTGYSNSHPPRLVFVRTGVDGEKNDASGILYTKTGSANPSSNWKFEYSVGGGSWITTGSSAFDFVMPDNNHYLNLRLSISGSDVTIPVIGYVQVTHFGGGTVSTPITYIRYFDTGTDALKKKDNSVSQFSIDSDLSFLLSQNDLDTLYSSAGYTDNNWPFTEGDFDF